MKNYKHISMFFTLEMIEAKQLAAMLDDGWELVGMAPFRMVPQEGGGGTIVKEYAVTLRRPADIGG